MDLAEYKKVKNFLRHGILPQEYSSNKSNFLAKTRHYTLNANGFLMRNSKVVITKGPMAEKIFQELHDHSGRIACWNRIKQR